MYGDGFIFRIAFQGPLPAAEALSGEPFQHSRERALRTPSTGFPERVRGTGRTQARAPLAAPAPAPPARRFPQSPATPRLRDRARLAAEGRRPRPFGRCPESLERPQPFAGGRVRPFPARRTSASSAVACRKWLPAGRGSGGSCAACKAGSRRRERLLGTRVSCRRRWRLVPELEAGRTPGGSCGSPEQPRAVAWKGLGVEFSELLRAQGTGRAGLGPSVRGPPEQAGCCCPAQRGRAASA